VPAPLVIEHFEVVEQLGLRVGMAGEPFAKLALDVEKNASMTALS
jgi:hypothetical protein